MKSVGDCLKEKRLELGWSLEDVQRQTKIQKEFLKAIETGDFNIINNNTTAKGFLRNYALCLGLAPESVLAIFRRDYSENQVGTVLPRSVLTTSINQRLWWTPKATFIIFIVALVLIVGGYLGRQYYRLSVGPDLSISSPTDGQVFIGKVKISGNTNPDTVVKVQGMFIALNEKGEFNEEMVLPRGDNILTIESTDRKGKIKVIKVKVKVE